MYLGPSDAQLALQAAVTKTASFDSVGLDLGDQFATDEPGQPMIAAIGVTARDHTTGDETYTFTLQQSSDNATFADVSPVVTVTGAGNYLAKGWVTQRYVRVHMVAGGTTPSITYSATLDPGEL